jgi:hypothetical protein
VNKKKNIIGSIGTVALILLTSFTMVIGKQVNNETSANSPLFALRIQKTINREKKAITSYYLGRGRENEIPFIYRDNRFETLNIIIERISKMGDNQLTELAGLIGSNTMINANRQQILRLLYQIKNNPDEIKKQLSVKPTDTSHITRSPRPTYCYYECPFPSSLYNWAPGCLLSGLFVLIFRIIEVILAIIGITTVNIENCFTSACTIDCTNDHGCSYP